MGVPTVWLNLLQYLEEYGKSVPTLKRVVVGGAACPASIMTDMQEKHVVYVHIALVITEMSPLGTYNTFKD